VTPRPHAWPTTPPPLASGLASALACVVVASLAACGGPTSASPSPTASSSLEQTTSPTPSATPTPPPTSSPDPAAAPLFVDTDTQAYAAWEQATGADRELLSRIASTPQARWIGDWYPDNAAVTADVADYTGRAADADAVATLVLYAIPGRDCGQYSAGGVDTRAYAAWVDAVAAGITGEPIVILEPDALANLGDCDGQGDRAGYLRYGVAALTAAGARVYIDAGHSGWLPVDTAVERLRDVGVTEAAGFALNTSNYQTTDAERAYGEQVAAALGGDVGFVVDVSRNGNGSNGEWCNPRGRALGEVPRLVDDGTHLDALLWVKSPGESDGTCNGGPDAGQWWQEIALELVRNAA
jgi:endoglucanase